MNIILYPIIGFCATAVAIALSKILDRVLRDKKDHSDG